MQLLALLSLTSNRPVQLLGVLTFGPLRPLIQPSTWQVSQPEQQIQYLMGPLMQCMVSRALLEFSRLTESAESETRMALKHFTQADAHMSALLGAQLVHSSSLLRCDE